MFVKENSDKKKNCCKLKENNTKICNTAFNHGDVENSLSYLLNAMLRILGGLKLNREASIYYKFYLKDWFATKHYPQQTLDTMQCEKKWIILYDDT